MKSFLMKKKNSLKGNTKGLPWSEDVHSKTNCKTGIWTVNVSKDLQGTLLMLF